MSRRAVALLFSALSLFSSDVWADAADCRFFLTDYQVVTSTDKEAGSNQSRLIYAAATGRLYMAESQLTRSLPESVAGIYLHSMELNWLAGGRIGYISISRIGDPFNALAFWRVYDGSESKLPRENYLDLMGRRTETYNNLRHQGFQLFEIGKYYLNPNLDPQERKFLRNELRTWFKRIYLEIPGIDLAKRKFILDPILPMHRRLYRHENARPFNDGDFHPALTETPDDALILDSENIR